MAQGHVCRDQEGRNPVTIPDKLVTAAAGTLCLERLGVEPCDDCKDEARRVVAAAFAALPECEEAHPPLWKLPDARLGWHDCLAALARMAE